MVPPRSACPCQLYHGENTKSIPFLFSCNLKMYSVWYISSSPVQRSSGNHDWERSGSCDGSARPNSPSAECGQGITYHSILVHQIGALLCQVGEVWPIPTNHHSTLLAKLASTGRTCWLRPVRLASGAGLWCHGQAVGVGWIVASSSCSPCCALTQRHGSSSLWRAAGRQNPLALSPPQTLGKERGACAKLLQLQNLRLRSVWCC